MYDNFTFSRFKEHFVEASNRRNLNVYHQWYKNSGNKSSEPEFISKGEFCKDEHFY